MLLVEHGALLFDSSRPMEESPILAAVHHSPIVLHSILSHCGINSYSRIPFSLKYLFSLALHEKQNGVLSLFYRMAITLLPILAFTQLPAME